MNFLKKLFSSQPSRIEKRYYTFTVKCLRCGELIEGRVALDNDPSVGYDDGKAPTGVDEARTDFGALRAGYVSITHLQLT